MQMKQIPKTYNIWPAIIWPAIALAALLSGCGESEKIVVSEPVEVIVDEAPVLETKQITVHFDYKKAILSAVAEQELTLVVQQLKDHPRYRVELIGHTDGVASAPYNVRLSQQRAEAVRDFFAVHGIAADRITMAWEGEARPVADNATKDGRAQNRRTEITLRPTLDTPSYTAMLESVGGLL